MFESVGLLIVTFTILANLFIALIVYRNNSKSASNILLSLLAIFLSFWALSNFLALSPGSESIRLFWVRMVMLITTPFGPLIFLLAKTFPEEKLVVEKGLAVCLVVFNLLISILALSPYMFTNLVNNPDGGFQLFPGFAIILYAVNLIGFLVWGFVILFHKYKKSTSVLRKQLSIVIVGIFTSFGLMTVTNFIAVVVFKSIKLTFIGPSLTLIMIGFIAYAIVKHKLLNIKVLATQLFVIVILLILLAKILTFSSANELILDTTIFIAVSIFSYLLIQSVNSEVKQKEILQDLTDKLKALDKQKDEFLSMAAHELRAPMTAIKGYVSMVLEGDTGDIPEKARGFLADTSNITDRLIRLVNNMLNVSRIEEGRMTYQTEEEHLSVPVRMVFSQFTPEAERKGLEYKLIIPNEIKDKVVVDPDRIQEVVGNFISNAVKYTDEGSIQVKMLQPNESVIRVEVIDSGTGISEEEQNNLFQKFHRVESNVGKTTGTGLGLYISKLLIEKFKGKIGITSKPGRGSTFWFELPLIN